MLTHTLTHMQVGYAHILVSALHDNIAHIKLARVAQSKRQVDNTQKSDMLSTLRSTSQFSYKERSGLYSSQTSKTGGNKQSSVDGNVEIYDILTMHLRVITGLLHQVCVYMCVCVRVYVCVGM
jgi:hypothetical protein